MRLIVSIVLLVFFSVEINSQSNLLNAKNPSEIGVSSSIESINPSFLEYPEIDEKDILWSKVVYEYIDLNEKLNFPLLFPVNDEQYTDTRKSFWKVIRENIENGNIKEVFDVRNDNFLEKNRITGTEKIKDFYGSKYTPGDSRPQTFASSADISAYRIKGVWYFDKLHSELKYRLLEFNHMEEILRKLVWSKVIFGFGIHQSEKFLLNIKFLMIKIITIESHLMTF